MKSPEPVYLENMPTWVAKELDRRWGLVKSGHITGHKNDGEAVKFEHRDVGSAKDLKAS